MKIITIVLFFISCHVSVAQFITMQFGAGMGITTEPKIRGIVFTSVYLKVKPSFHLGIELSSSGGLTKYPTKSTFTSSDHFLIDPSGMNANSTLAKFKYIYKLSSHESINLFLDLGLGKNTFIYKNPTSSVSKIESNSFAVKSDVGVNLSKFVLSICYFYGGKTPGFEGAEIGYQVTIPESNFSMFYLRASYKLSLFKEKNSKE